jgi:hypothetical protein
MLCLDAYRWRQIENLLNQQGIVSVAGSDATLAFTEGELRELGLEEVDALRAANHGWDMASQSQPPLAENLPLRYVGGLVD